MTEESGLTISAQSEEEAIEDAVHSLEIEAEDLVAERLSDEADENGNYRFRVTRREALKTYDPAAAREALTGLLRAMEIEAKVEDEVDGKYMHMTIETEDSGLLIGKHGKTLESLQLMVNLMVQKRDPDCGLRVVLDTGGYRGKRGEQLQEMTQRAIERVLRTKEEYEFAPMNPADRRLVHRLILETEGVMSLSRGLGENRYVVLTAVDENGQPISRARRPRRPTRDHDRGRRDDRHGNRGPRSDDRRRSGGRDDRRGDRGPRDRPHRPRETERDTPSVAPLDAEALAILEGEKLSGRLATGEATVDEVFGGDSGDRGPRSETRPRGGRDDRRGDRGPRDRDRGPRDDRRGGERSGTRAPRSDKGPARGPRERDRGGQTRPPRSTPSYRLPDEPLWASEGKDPEFD